MSSDSHLVEHRLGGRTLLSGGFLEVVRDDVRLPDGARATREYIKHSGAVAMIPLLDDGRIVLVRQYRYPVRKVLLEFPAGKLDAGESQLACAVRELKEETGYEATEWAWGGAIHNAPAYADETIWLWFARGLTAGEQQLDAEEFIETVLMTPDELEAVAVRGELPDVKTQIGLAWLQRVLAGRQSLTWNPLAGAEAVAAAMAAQARDGAAAQR